MGLLYLYFNLLKGDTDDDDDDDNNNNNNNNNNNFPEILNLIPISYELSHSA